MTNSLTYSAFLKDRGISLEALGLSERALSQADALQAIELVESEGGAILGGDVYIEDAGRVESAYANWFSERRDGEPIETFAVRSCVESRSYVSTFPKQAKGHALFVLVVAEESEAYGT